jgi:branched-chain amino acid transport system permease protein
MSRPRFAAAGGLVILLPFLVLLPFVLSSYHLQLATKMLIFALFAMSLDLLLGYAGMASLGHAAFFGVAAYTMALLLVRANIDARLAFSAGLIAAATTGAVFGLLALRARGSYFLMITLALAQTLWGIAFGWRTMTGGDDGLNVPRIDLGLPWSLANAIPFYYFVLLLVGVAVVLLVCIVRSPFGYALRGIRESESRMLALGYDVWRYKYLAFILAAMFAGLAGCLYVLYNRFVSPEYLHVIQSAEALLMVILGGAGTLAGPAIGAVVIVFLENVVSTYTQRWLMILGCVYVIVTLLAPRGLVGLVRHYWQRRSGS